MPDLATDLATVRATVRAARAAYVAASDALDNERDRHGCVIATATLESACETYVLAACDVARRVGATGAGYGEEEDLIAACGVDLDDVSDDDAGRIVVAYDLALARHDARDLSPHDALERSARAYGAYLACEAIAREAREAAEETGVPEETARAYRAAREATAHASGAYRAYSRAALVASIAIRPAEGDR